MTSLHRLAVPTALVLALLVSPARAELIVLDGAGGPGADFTQPFNAFLALQDGDVLLIRAGSYTTAPSQPLRITGISATVAAEEGADVELTARLTIRDLAPDQQVTIRGVDLRPTDAFLPQSATVTVTDCAGPVWLEDVTVLAEHVTGQALHVADSDRVTLHRCTVDGGTMDSTAPGRVGLLSQRSSVWLHDTLVAGGTGGPPDDIWTAFPGGDGALVVGGQLFAAATTFRGGDAGSAQGVVMLVGYGNGGPGLNLGRDDDAIPEEAVAVVRGGLLEGGAPSDGVPGASMLGVPGTVLEDLGGDAPFLSATSPVRKGSSSTFTVRGRPGELLVLLVSLAPDALWLTGPQVDLFTGAPTTAVPLLVMPAPQISFDLRIPNGLGPDREVPLFFQALLVGQAVSSSGGSTVLALDAGT